MSGEDVYIRVSDHDGFVGLNGQTGGLKGGGFGDERQEAVWVRLLGVEGVAAVDSEEEAIEAEVGADLAGGVDGLVGEDGHGQGGVCLADGLEGVDHTGVDVGVVELVGAVEVQEEGKGFVQVVGFDGVGVAEGAANEHGGTVADVAGDDGLGKGGTGEMGEGGVDGVAEILAGVNEGAV